MAKRLAIQHELRAAIAECANKNISEAARIIAKQSGEHPRSVAARLYRRTSGTPPEKLKILERDVNALGYELKIVRKDEPEAREDKTS